MITVVTFAAFRRPMIDGAAACTSVVTLGTVELAAMVAPSLRNEAANAS